MMNMNHEPQLDMDYWTHPIVGHWTPNLTLSNIGHHLINIIITYQFTI